MISRGSLHHGTYNTWKKPTWKCNIQQWSTVKTSGRRKIIHFKNNNNYNMYLDLQLFLLTQNYIVKVGVLSWWTLNWLFVDLVTSFLSPFHYSSFSDVIIQFIITAPHSMLAQLAWHATEVVFSRRVQGTRSFYCSMVFILPNTQQLSKYSCIKWIIFLHQAHPHL